MKKKEIFRYFFWCLKYFIYLCTHIRSSHEGRSTVAPIMIDPKAISLTKN